MRRNWIKIYVDQCLRGTMMDEMQDPAERFVWFGVLLLAGDSAYEGKISLTEDMGYSDEQLGSMLKCDPQLIKRAKKKMVKFDKIKILKNNIIQIVNWKKYQSEYQRQKPYRSEDGQKLLRKVTTEGDDLEGEGDIDRDIEEDIEGEKKKEEEDLPHLRIKFNFKKKRWQGIIKEDMKLWKETFPDLDIDYWLKRMKNWILTNPRKGKKKNYAKFINNWLSGEQDKIKSTSSYEDKRKKKLDDWTKKPLED